MQPITFPLSHAEIEFLTDWLTPIAESETAFLEPDRRAIVSVVREFIHRLAVPPYSIPKPQYKRKLKYHEAYYLHQLLMGWESLPDTHSGRHYYDALQRTLLAKIDKLLY